MTRRSKESHERAYHVPGGASLFQRMFTRLGCLGRPPEFHVEFYPYSSLTHTIRLREHAAFVRLSDVLRSAPPVIMEAAAGILLGRLYRRAVPLVIAESYRAYVVSPGVRRRIHALRRKRVRHAPLISQGAHHNLQKLYERLNRQYFSGRLRTPRIGWSRRAWSRQLGCFDGALGQILLNRVLDRPEVPEFAVAYVLYHEMLHQKHPLRLARCRLESHSESFRREERQFAEYAAAVRFLKRFR
jgi:hypothetical protein